MAQSTWFANASNNATTSTVSNLGDATLWTETTNGKGAGGYAVARYPYLMDVMVAGLLPSSPESYGVKLLALTQNLLSKLQ